MQKEKETESDIERKEGKEDGILKKRKRVNIEMKGRKEEGYRQNRKEEDKTRG